MNVLQKIKSDLQARGRFDSATPSIASQQYKNVSGAAKNTFLDAADQIDPAQGQQLRNANKRFEELSTAEDVATEAALKEAISPIRRGVDLAGVASVGALGGVLGGAGVGIPALVAAHLLRTRGRASAAVLLDTLSKIMGPEEAQKIIQQLGAKAAPMAGEAQ